MSNDAPRPGTVPVSPDARAADCHKTRAACLSAGITAEGTLFFCSRGHPRFPRCCAKGTTLHDLAWLMIEEGAVAAMHLDRGGSTQVFCHGGGALIAPRDVHHDP